MLAIIRRIKCSKPEGSQMLFRNETQGGSRPLARNRRYDHTYINANAGKNWHFYKMRLKESVEVFCLKIYTAAYVEWRDNSGYSVSPLELGSTLMKQISNTTLTRCSKHSSQLNMMTDVLKTISNLSKVIILGDEVQAWEQSAIWAHFTISKLGRN